MAGITRGIAHDITHGITHGITHDITHGITHDITRLRVVATRARLRARRGGTGVGTTRALALALAAGRDRSRDDARAGRDRSREDACGPDAPRVIRRTSLDRLLCLARASSLSPGMPPALVQQLADTSSKKKRSWSATG